MTLPRPLPWLLSLAGRPRAGGQRGRTPMVGALVGVVLVTTATAGSVASPRVLLSAVQGLGAVIGSSAPVQPPQQGVAERPPAALSVVPSPAAAAGVVSPLPLAPVARLGALIQPDLLISRAGGLSDRERRNVQAANGVRATLLLATGQVHLAGAVARALSADPSSLRAWTPGPTASSDALWARIAGGEMAASFDLAKNLRLPLGGSVPLAGEPGPALRLGALASLGLPGLDLTVSPARAAQLGLTPNAAMLVSAPGADPLALRDTLRSRLGTVVDVQLLRQVTVVRDAGSFLTRVQIATALRAALSRVGAPYVWGATGPNTFDCSGLVGYAFSAAGIALPRTSEQLWFAGPHVPSQDARPGDLLFWANDPAAPGDIDHVALYLGGGLMVSAPHTGEAVHVSAIPSSNFRGVVRLDPAAARAVGGGMWSPGAAP